MYIQYHNYIIRNAEEKDAEKLTNWWNDGKVMEHAGFPNGLQITKEKVKQQLEKHDDNNRRLIMEYDGTLIGEMCYTHLGDSVDIGIKICNFDYQNQGHGRIFLSMLIERLFHKGYQKIVLDTMIENIRAQHVYESLGFVKQGVKIDCWKDQVGNMRSAVDYCLHIDNFNSYVTDVMILDIDDVDCDSIYQEMKNLVYTYEDLSTINVEYVMNWMYRKVHNHKEWYKKVIYQHDVVGYYAINDDELEDFYILDAYRGQGIGTKIMGEYIHSNTLCVFKKNERAIAFYQRFGFEIVEEMKTRYIMKKGR